MPRSGFTSITQALTAASRLRPETALSAAARSDSLESSRAWAAAKASLSFRSRLSRISSSSRSFAFSVAKWRVTSLASPDTISSSLSCSPLPPAVPAAFSSGAPAPTGPLSGSISGRAPSDADCTGFPAVSASRSGASLPGASVASRRANADVGASATKLGAGTVAGFSALASEKNGRAEKTASPPASAPARMHAAMVNPRFMERRILAARPDSASQNRPGFWGDISGHLRYIFSRRLPAGNAKKGPPPCN